ncbi:hypothetical protein [Bacillus benzoevorans]|uniref:Uncharacterized protein n=1 Tax=Bacillus benzoevorans TaxID=1456 RepID=A0A7X0HYH9_9BACI|nr:hypothetical protein [Bacillus benzoevorans]MBB6447935.1 hypothetical protein [Bacillus benzoevorans]
MGHDIIGYNKSGKEIAYARFGMSNYNAIILYSLLDAEKYYAGVSGSGHITSFSIQQIEKAYQLFKSGEFLMDQWDRKQILNFVQNCLAAAQKEGSVRVAFC